MNAVCRIIMGCLVLAHTCVCISHIELRPHEQWWEHNFNNPLWLGGIHMASRDLMRRHIVAHHYKSILDIPCAYGIDYEGLKAYNIDIDYVGMDITPKIVADCQKRGLAVKQGSIEAIPAPDSSFDIVYARHILEHLDYYTKAISELIRVAKKEVFIVFFIKPSSQPDAINSGYFNDSLQYNNCYNSDGLEKFIRSFNKVDSVEWQHVDNFEVIAHIYLKKLPEQTTIDFDVSLGKYDGPLVVGNIAYDLFNDLFSAQPVFSGGWDAASRPKPVQELYTFLKTLYQKNIGSQLQAQSNYQIPPTIHQIWIQGDLPPQYKQWQKSWQNLPHGWTYKLWTDKEIRELPLKNRERYENATNFGQKSDIARFEILNLFGGVYADTDFECINPQAFDLYNRSHTFYAGIAPLDCAHLILASGLIAAAPGHPVIGDMLDYLSRYDPAQPVHLASGPIPFTQAFWRSADKPGYNDIALPPSFFYPVGTYTVVGGAHVTPGHYQHLIRPETVAVHYWGKSWTNAPRY